MRLVLPLALLPLSLVLRRPVPLLEDQDLPTAHLPRAHLMLAETQQQQLLLLLPPLELVA
jgi:hypothetical protein